MIHDLHLISQPQNKFNSKLSPLFTGSAQSSNKKHVISSKIPNTPAGLTAESGRGKSEGLTKQERTHKRRYKPRARRCQCGCRQSFTPSSKARNPRFASDACRKRWHRQQAAKHRQPKVPELALFTCDHCGRTFFANKGRIARYCKPAHRTAAYNSRRTAAIVALATIMNYSLVEAADLLDVIGLRRVCAHLRLFEYEYSSGTRTWERMFPTM